MPRRDGFPTNPELVTEFTETSRLVYIAAFNQIIAHRLDELPYLRDKPLSMVPLIMYRNRLFDEGTDGIVRPDARAVAKETLKVKTTDSGDAYDRREHLTLKSLPEADHVAYGAVAARMEQLTITDDLVAEVAIEPHGVTAEYWADMHNGKRRHIGTLKEKPAKQSILSGKFFAEDMHETITSPGSSARMAIAREVFARLGMEPIQDVSFRLALEPSLPLNGYEPRRWLERYLDSMADGALRARDGLERMQSSKYADMMPEVIIESQKSRVAEYEAAASRALAILESK